MEFLAEKITHFFLQQHYIEPNQEEWFNYGLVRRMMGCLTFLVLLPVGAALAGWGGSFLYMYTFRFLRTRTGGFHAKTPKGCLATSLSTMIIALSLANFITESNLGGIILIGSSILIFILAPANNAFLHLTTNEIDALRPRVWLRLLITLFLGSLFFHISIPLGNCIAVSMMAVAGMLILSNLGFGVQ